MTSAEEELDRYQNALAMLDRGSFDLAVKKLQSLAANGDGHADCVLGGLFEFGDGPIAPDPIRALHFYERSIASVNSLQAWMGVGRLSLGIDPRVQDYSRAYQSFTYVAENANYPQAWLMLGEMQLQGLGAKRDLSAATESFKRAAALGNVYGYTGIAKVAHAERRYLTSFWYRMVAVAKMFFALVTKEDGGEDVKPW